MPTNPESVRVEDLIAQAMQEGKVIKGVNDPEGIADLQRFLKHISGSVKQADDFPTTWFLGLLAIERMKSDWDKTYRDTLTAFVEAVQRSSQPTQAFPTWSEEQISSAALAMRALAHAWKAKIAESTSSTFNVRTEPSPEVELTAKALRIAGSPQRLSQWMQTPVPALNGQTPYSLMHTEQGRKQVEDVLGRIEHGVY